jgi:pimeloyl-ACP methyl ester carboxylesterase
MSYALHYKISNVFAGETDQLWMPRNPRTGQYGVILCHGYNTPDTYSQATFPRSAKLVSELARHGIPSVAGLFGGDTWANDTAMSRITAAHSYLATATGASSTKVHLFGMSMGNALALRYAALNPTKVASVTGIIPLSSIANMYEANNPAGSRASIGTAWGVTYPTPLPAGADLLALAPTLQANTIPYRAYYSSVDQYIAVADVQALADAAGGTAAEIDSTYGHADAALTQFNVIDHINFLVANGA